MVRDVAVESVRRPYHVLATEVERVSGAGQYGHRSILRAPGVSGGSHQIRGARLAAATVMPLAPLQCKPITGGQWGLDPGWIKHSNLIRLDPQPTTMQGTLWAPQRALPPASQLPSEAFMAVTGDTRHTPTCQPGERNQPSRQVTVARRSNSNF
jgi:hypothetical protein